MYEKVVRELLESAGIRVNGNRAWDIRVKNKEFYKRVIRAKGLGLGESYMEGWWECERIDEFICRILRARLDEKVRGDIFYLLRFLPNILFNLQSLSRSRVIAERHYDLDNDLFFSFLDPYKQYSCAWFYNTRELNQAQINKLELIAKKMEIDQNDHLLDIGCGWGGLAKYMCETYGTKVTGVNISKEQLSYARQFCKGLDVEFIDSDYRLINGKYDKIVSVGMFEHVGHKNYRVFMSVVHRCLKDDGIFLLHTIGSNVSKRNVEPWINKYIFPNGMLPSLAQIAKGVEGLFIIEDIHNLGPHYDLTLMAWYRNFQKAWPDLSKRYSHVFKRMWDFYLLSCAGSFRARSIQIWQIVFIKQGVMRKQPSCR